MGHVDPARAEAVAPAVPYGAGAAATLAQFFIPAAASLEERRPRTLKHGDTFAVFDHNGDALSGPGSPEGLYHRDTRHLSHYYLTVEDARPILLSSTLRDDNAALTCDLMNPDLLDEDGRIVVEHGLIHLRRSRFLWKGICFERIALRNFDDGPQRLRLQIAFAADFADLFEVRGTSRPRHGHIQPVMIAQDGVTLAYVGLDGKRRETQMRFDPAPGEVAADRVVFDIDLAPRETKRLFIEIRCGENRSPDVPQRAFFMALREAVTALRTSAARAASVASSNDVFNESLRRSISDLSMLTTEKPQGPYPYAGIPWFSTVFGRDGLITAMEVLWIDPDIARGVLGYLAANQATEVDPTADAEPGKILHEVRHGEMAELGEVPFRRYYGSIDSTPLFVMLAGAYFERTGDLDHMRGLWPNIEAALHWIDTYGDRDGDGFIEYRRSTSTGLVNQGWKDSNDSIFHADGALAEGPIALAEVQAYVYGAWRAAAQIARRLGDIPRAATLDRRAAALQRRFDAAFFDEELGTYVLALDGGKRPCRVRASNAGHVLFAGLAFPERAAAVADRLMHGAQFSGWGVRTVANTEARYNPMSYHNGSVWPHDNAIIAAGLARYGFRDEAARIFEGLFSASVHIDLRRLPELFCGFPRRGGRGPTFYPVACSPQAWAAAAPLWLIQSCLGLEFDIPGREVRITRPVLPQFLDEVVVRRLAVGDGSVDIALRRERNQVLVNVLDRRGDVRVTTTT